MTDRGLRYFGAIITGSLIVNLVDEPGTALGLAIISTFSIMFSCLYYYHKGYKRDEL